MTTAENSARLRAAKRLSQRDRADILMRLAEFRLTRQHRRRDYEWRVSLGLWAALISALVTIKHRPDAYILAISLCAAVVLHLVFWVIPLARRNRFDMEMAFFFADRAAEFVVTEGYEIKPAPDRKATPDTFGNRCKFWIKQGVRALGKDAWSGLFPVFVTIALALIDWALIGTPSLVSASSSDTQIVSSNAQAPVPAAAASARTNGPASHATSHI